MHDNRLSPARPARGGPPHAPLRGAAAPRTGRSSPSTPTGSGRVAEVFGDLDTARAGLGRRARRRHRPAHLPAHRTSSTRRPSAWPSRCTRPSARRAPATRTAVIAWADYTAPAGLGIDSATAMRAEDGAVRLNALVRRAARQPRRSRCSATATARCCAGSPRTRCRPG